jgi:hypothetical protein
MKLSKALLGALLLGIAVETTSCNKKDDNHPVPFVSEKDDTVTPPIDLNNPDCCPACGRG